MNLIEYAEELSKVLEAACDSVNTLGDIDKHGAAWFFELNDEIIGFVSVEDNIEDINLPTISIAIKISDITNFSKEELISLFEVNANLFRAVLTSANIDDSIFLLLQYKSTLEVFIPTEFIEVIDHLINQAELFIFND